MSKTLKVTTPSDREIEMTRVFDAPRRLVFDCLTKPERLVATEAFDDPWYPGEALDTTVLIEQGGKTTVTTTVLCDSQEIRDAVLKSGMTRGVAESYDKLDELLASPLAAEVE